MKSYVYSSQNHLLKLFFIFIWLGFTCINISARAQENKWTMELDPECFIENNGQYIPITGKPVLFKARTRGTDIYLTESSVVYVYNTPLFEDSKTLKKRIEEGESVKLYSQQYFRINFQGKVSKQNIVKKDRVSHTYHFYKGGKTLTSLAYNEIIYQNFYPNIDLIFHFHPEGGLKYDFILHKGAQLSDIKIHYPDALLVEKETDTELKINSSAGTFYEKQLSVTNNENHKKQNIKYKKTDHNTFTVDIPGFDYNNSYRIDPWIVNPFGANLKGHNLDYDNKGNVYVETSEPSIVKYNSSGVLQWTFALPSLGGGGGGIFFGGSVFDLTVDRRSGSIYYNEFGVKKLNTSGVLIDSLVVSNPVPGEWWRIAFDHCNDQIIVGNGADYQLSVIDTLLNTITSYNYFASSFTDDVATLELDPNGTDLYINPETSNTMMNGLLMKFSLATIGTPTWTVNDSLWYLEPANATYKPGANGVNASAVGPDYIYSYIGDTIIRRDKSNGNFLNMINSGGTHKATYGIDANLASNVFVGANNEIKVYDQNLSQLGTLSIPDTCYDVMVTEDGILYACGNNFLTEIGVSPYSNVISTNVQNSTCNQCDGQAEVIMSAADTSDFTYSWQPSGQTSSIATGLCPGYEILYVIYGCDTIYQDSIYIPQNSSISIDLGNDTTVCTGSLTLDAGDPTAVWQDSSTGQTFQVTSSGQYWATITDSQGCIASDTINILIDEIVIDLGPDTLVCELDPVNITFSSNVSGNSYQWQDNSTLQSFTATTFGTYWVTVDSSGCIGQDTVQVISIPAPVVDLGNDTILCADETLNLDAGNPGSDYNWQDASSNQNFNVSAAGTFWVEVTVGGCAASDTIIVDYAILSLDLGNDTIVCNPNFTLDAENPGFSYLWQDGSSNQTYTVTDTGTYFVTITDPVSNCQISDTVIVSLGSISVNLGNDTAICAPQSLLLDAENPGATYNWSTGSTNQTINVTSTNTYSVTVTEGLCTDSDQIFVEFTQPISQFSVSDTIGCAPQDVDFTDLSSPSDDIVSWHWEFGDGNTSDVQHPSHYYSNNGNYLVSLTVTDVNGCLSDSSRTVKIEIYDNPVAKFTFTPTEPEINEVVQFTDMSTNAITWDWSFGDGNYSTIQHPSHAYAIPYTYSVYLVVGNHECIDTAYGTITIEEELIFYIPNVFTPNQDDFNNVFQPVFTSGFDPYDFNMKIFNRWGEIIFESYDASKSWDGTYNGKIVQDGTYIWQIRFGNVNDDKTYFERGHVTIVR